MGTLVPMTALSRGWMLLAAIFAVLLITNVTAYLLIAAIKKDRENSELEIRTPFLSITSKPSSSGVRARSK